MNSFSPFLQAQSSFQGKHPGEVFEFKFHQHWILLVWPICKFIIWNVLIISLAYITLVVSPIVDIFTKHFALTVIMMFFLLAHFELLMRIYRYLLYIVIVTDKKIHRIKKTLFFIDDHLSMDLWMAQDIQKCQNRLAHTVFGFGTIIVEAQDSQIRLHFTPRISKIYEKFMHIREQAREKMSYVGLKKEGK